jgi:hypothetical protein
VIDIRNLSRSSGILYYEHPVIRRFEHLTSFAPDMRYFYFDRSVFRIRTSGHFYNNWLALRTSKTDVRKKTRGRKGTHPIKVAVDRVGYGEGCTVSSFMDATTTNMVLKLPTSPELLGASVNVTCKK